MRFITCLFLILFAWSGCIKDQGGNGSDTYGFNARPGGQMFVNGQVDGKDLYAFFWTSGPLNSDPCNEVHYVRALQYDDSRIYRTALSSGYYYTRCIQD